MDPASESYQRLVEDVYPRLVEVVTRRYRKRAGKSVLDVYRLDEDFLHLEPDNLEFAIANRAEIVELLADPLLLSSLVRLFVISTLEFTYANNQFIYVDQRDEQILESIYRSYLLGMKTILAAGGPPEGLKQQLEALIVGHFEDLRDNLSRYLDSRDPGKIEDSVIFNRVVCRQYSPAFQLKILSIRPEELQPPVLDVGCGKSGRLVKYLNAQGIRAYGVDRIVEHSEGLMEADWLDLPLSSGSWGTILSHMGFSNHFIFQHLYKRGNPQPYARQYMAILAALKAGGSFYYAPGLPFIERFLPAAQYTVIRRAILTGERLQADFGELAEGALYASQITRR